MWSLSGIDLPYDRASSGSYTTPAAYPFYITGLTDIRRDGPEYLTLGKSNTTLFATRSNTLLNYTMSTYSSHFLMSSLNLGRTDSKIVMAEQYIHDVVNKTQSMGENSPIGVPGNTITSNTSGEEEEVLGNTTEDSELAISISRSRSDTTDSNIGAETKNITSADIDEPVVNGQYQINTEPESTTYQNDSRLDDTGVSDVDVGKVDSMEQSKEGTIRHERSNSVIKKATSYKPVSVTKNFLAKTGTGPVVNGKAVNDKGELRMNNLTYCLVMLNHRSNSS